MIRRLALAVGVVLVLTGVVNTIAWHWDLATTQPPVDFELNWVGAHRLLDREPLYDRAESKQDGLDLVGPEFEFSNTGTYASYIGSPATALFYVPYVPFSHDVGAALFRVTDAVLMLVAIAIACLAVDRRSRAAALLVGWGLYLWSYPVAESIGLGQVDGFLMVALAVAIWASSRDRWRIVGAALGIAALLKISPALLIFYLVLRGRRAVVFPAVVSSSAVLSVALLVGRPADVVTWVTDVLPDVARGGLLVNNQSLPAWLARLFGTDRDWLSVATGLGAWRVVGWGVTVVGVACVFLLCRRRPFVVLELGAVVLVALLAGPVTWDHYPTWALLSIVLMADLRWWEYRRGIELAGLIGLATIGSLAMRKWTQYPTPDIVAADWTRRVESGSKTVGVMAYLAVAIWLLARPPSADRSGVDRRLDRDERAPRTTGAEGLHPHR
jgi:alpha-1,2-mannosyltransferase